MGGTILLRFGTIGTSKITNSFIEASRFIDDFELAAIYSRSHNKAQKIANKFGGGKVFTNLATMAKSNVIDCVYIASPNSLHYEHAITFLENKKHVICEKPIFSNRKELMEAFQIAKKHGVFLFEAMRNLYTPNFKKLLKELDKVGKIRSVFFHRVRYSSRYES